jgi:hypothetical protein
MPIGVFWRPDISLLEYTVSGNLSLIEYQRCLHDEQLLLEARHPTALCMLLDIHELRTLPPSIIQTSRRSFVVQRFRGKIRFIAVVGASSYFRTFISLMARTLASRSYKIEFFESREEALQTIGQLMIAV